MKSLFSLLDYILFGEFGLLTMTPRYLFCVLLPVMVFLGFFSALLERIPHLQNSRRSFFYGLAGLGCTTAALAASSSISNKGQRHRMVWILVLLIPCSSQITMIASFASMVTFRVFAAYLLFTGAAIAALFWLLNKVYPLTPLMADGSTSAAGPVHPFRICREAFLSVTSTIPSFCLGSTIISILTYLGFMESLSSIFAPLLNELLHLPQAAMHLFIVNLFKRDLGAASLLSFVEAGAFDGVQIVVIMVMLTFCVPCFNSTIVLFKQEKLPVTILLWLGSFCISFLFGFTVCHILLQCTF